MLNPAFCCLLYNKDVYFLKSELLWVLCFAFRYASFKWLVFKWEGCSYTVGGTFIGSDCFLSAPI